jgi:hypothetical protein
MSKYISSFSGRSWADAYRSVVVFVLVGRSSPDRKGN